MNNLLVIGNFHVPLKGRPFFAPLYSLFAFLIAAKARRIIQREGGKFVVLCPQFIADHIPRQSGIELVLWDEISNFARRYTGIQNEEFPEIFSFTEKVVGILEQHPNAQIKNISLPRALAAAFTSPHSEYFPFWVAGLQSMTQKMEIGKAITLGENAPLLSLARDALRTNQVESQKEKHIFTAILEKIDGWIQERIDRRSVDQILHKYSRQQQTDKLPEWKMDGPVVALFASKPRSLRFLSPIIERLKVLGKETIVFGHFFQEADQGTRGQSNFAPIQLLGSKARETANLYHQSMVDVWIASEEAIAKLPDSYRGVRISDHCANDLRRAWVQRGIDACVLADISPGLFEKLNIKALVLNDILEGSYIFSKRAQEHGIPRFLNYCVYSGSVATAVLWENYFSGLADHFAVINSWMRDRLIQAKIAEPKMIRVVGDVVLPCGIGPIEKIIAREEVCRRLSLQPDKKIVLLLSRVISPALLREDKKILFSKTNAACSELGVQFLIKGHPHEKRSVLEDEAKQWACDSKVLIDELPLSKLVMAADVAVNHPGSSTSLDCLLVRTPVIIIGPKSDFDRQDLYEDSYSYKRHGAAKCLLQTEDLVPVLRELLFDQSTADELIKKGLAFAERISGPIDGKTDLRIAEWVSEQFLGETRKI